jgi:hypothetical protein
MAAVLIAQIQIVMFTFKTQTRNSGNEILMLLEGSALAFVGLKFMAQNAQGHARIATIAIRSVGK